MKMDFYLIFDDKNICICEFQLANKCLILQVAWFITCFFLKIYVNANHLITRPCGSWLSVNIFPTLMLFSGLGPNVDT